MRTFVRLIVRGVRDLGLHPWTQLLTLAAVTLVAFLAGFGLLCVHNLEQWLGRGASEVQFQVYWKSDAAKDDVARQWQHIRLMADLTGMTTFTPDQALRNLGQTLSADFGWMTGDNPLPPTALAVFRLPPERPQRAEEIRRELASLPGVASVRFNPLQFETAKRWAAVGRRAVTVLTVFLGLVAGLSVGNTVRLSLLSRRDEVEILHLVGATPGYIRLPLLTSGALLGLLGGLIALGLLWSLARAANTLLAAPPYQLHLAFLPWPLAAALPGALMAVGLVSSWVAVRR